MSTSRSEQGMARTIGNFYKLIAQALTLPGYNPANPSLAITALTRKYNTADDSMTKVSNLLNTYSLAVDTRKEAFKALPRTITGVRNAAKATAVGDSAIEDMDTIIRQLRGARKGGSKAAAPAAPAAEGEEKRTISVSQQSFNHKVTQFKALVDLLRQIPKYNPNDEGYTLTDLETISNTLHAINENVVDKNATLTAIRTDRKKIMYEPVLGLVDTANTYKNYIKSVYTTKSPQWAQIKSLRFINRA